MDLGRNEACFDVASTNIPGKREKSKLYTTSFRPDDAKRSWLR
jgi:hypothetical protein